MAYLPADCGHLIPGATTIVKTCLQIRRGEDVVVLVDTPNSLVGMALAQTITTVGGNPLIIIFPPRSAHGEDPQRQRLPSL